MELLANMHGRRLTSGEMVLLSCRMDHRLTMPYGDQQPMKPTVISTAICNRGRSQDRFR